jgi:predicted metalloprotease
MRIPLIAVVTGAVVSLTAPLLASAPAAAAPRTVSQVTVTRTTVTQTATQTSMSDKSAWALPTLLTKNKIYRSGSPDALDCSPAAPQNGSAASVTRFLSQVRVCLNRMWTRQFAKVGLKFRAPKVVVSTTLTKSPCRRLTATTPAHYCPTLQAIYIRLLKTDIKQPFALALAKTLAHEYGHHVQKRVGILNSYYRLYFTTRGTTARRLLNHRMEVQAECWSGVFLSVTSDTLPVDLEQFDYIVRWTTKYASDTEHGKGRNIAYWLNRGYQSGSVNACNTWIAPNSRVT